MLYSVALVDFESNKEIEFAHAMKLIKLIMLRARHHYTNRLYSPKKAVWQIPKLILKACTISFNALNYIPFLIGFNVFSKLHEI